MNRMKLMGAVVAVLVVGCGTDPISPENEQTEQQIHTSTSVTCQDVEQVVDSIRNNLGTCTPNYKNQEPLAFSRSACDEQLSTLCDETGLAEARLYVNCLQSISACVPAQQSIFDEAIDECLDTFQNSAASGECIELVVGD
ncbi:hypothetical protein [Hyalangium versicolor]|uniref:hypothetical protein n=1 Tax=Hyalangium versicolor TaxID=2861190 RepID=UPI001CCA8868|nr:hypothetical protein [Hyalangium versicolor]